MAIKKGFFEFQRITAKNIGLVIINNEQHFILLGIIRRGTNISLFVVTIIINGLFVLHPCPHCTSPIVMRNRKKFQSGNLSHWREERSQCIPRLHQRRKIT